MVVDTGLVVNRVNAFQVPSLTSVTRNTDTMLSWRQQLCIRTMAGILFRPSGEFLSLVVSAQIGSREEVISSGKVVRCPRGKVPNEVNARRTSHGVGGWLREKPPGHERQHRE